MMFREIKLDDDDLLFQPDAIDQYLYFCRYRTGETAGPEKKLMLAVLEDALRCLEQHVAAETRRDRELRREVEEWLLSDSDDSIFSFRNVCETLGLSPAYLRKRVLCWKARQFATLSIETAAASTLESRSPKTLSSNCLRFGIGSGAGKRYERRNPWAQKKLIRKR